MKEQRGLCCYCLSRIRAEYKTLKIEHWHSQNRYEAERLDYSNLLGACMGSEGHSGKDQHCDARKGDRDLSRNPAFDAEINEVLNLNLQFLMNNRKATLTAFQGLLGRGQLSRPSLEKLLRKWKGESDAGNLEPLCQVVVYWLRKRLARI